MLSRLRSKHNPTNNPTMTFLPINSLFLLIIFYPSNFITLESKTMITYPALLFIACIANFSIPGTDAHGYVKSPRSRNYVANQDGKWSGGTENDPKIETCPHCLNRGGICGRNNEHNYNTPLNSFGDAMPVNIQETFIQGQEYEFSAVLTAHHKGHFEYKACPIKPGEIPTQECFDLHPLEFVEDVFYNAPKDPKFPERAYIPLSEISTQKDGGSYLYKHKYKLPSHLSGNLVLIQWHYVTANSCLPEGYDQYNWPEGFYPGDLPTCGPLPPDGDGVPEQFWNCIEVGISASNPSPVTSPVNAPTLSPTRSPTNAPQVPTMSPTLPSPVSSPTSAPVPPTPTDSPILPVMCSPGDTGLVPKNGCNGEFYHCANGSLVSNIPITCPEGLLYSTDELCMCNFAFVL